jgi:hypothetical protein
MIPAQRSVFYGFGAWVGQQTSPTECRWWAQEPNSLATKFDPQHLITVDLAKNPAAARAGTIGVHDIHVDDPPASGGGTKIGPTWPTGSTWNACWLEASIWKQLSANTRPPRVGYGMQCFDYELSTVLYWAGPLVGRRFWGFHAEITSEQGANALCSIWPAGKSRIPGQLPMGSWWLNLSQVAHPVEPEFTQIAVGVGAPKRGALFLESGTASNLLIGDPKLPPSCAADSYLVPR